jgi:hypothetical protein
MLKEEVDLFLSEVRTFMRDFKIKEVMEQTGNNIKIVEPKKSLFSFLWKGNKTKDQLNELGGILTGSRALSLYRFNGEPIISRKPQDWDYLLDKRSFMKFCGLNNLTNLKYEHDRITLNLVTGIYTYNAGYGTYDPRYLFRYDFDIIAKEQMPIYFQVGSYKVSTLESIIEEKIKMIEREGRSGKHLTDLIQIMSKIEAYGK